MGIQPQDLPYSTIKGKLSVSNHQGNAMFPTEDAQIYPQVLSNNIMSSLDETTGSLKFSQVDIGEKVNPRGHIAK